MTSGAPELKSLMQGFEAVEDYLRVMRETIRKGHMPNMAGLDDRVSSLCLAIQDAPPEAQEQCRGKLNDLLKKLDQCEEEVNALHKSSKPGEHK